MNIEICGGWLLRDDSKIRCILPKGHDGLCHAEPPVYGTVRIKPYMREVKRYEPDPDFRSVTRDGDGLSFTVPTWLAEQMIAAGLAVDEVDG
jgi:hypothetical protein